MIFKKLQYLQPLDFEISNGENPQIISSVGLLFMAAPLYPRSFCPWVCSSTLLPGSF